MTPTEKYQAARAALETTADGLGLGVDPEIKHAVAALQAAGFETTASCAGHLDRGLPYPWIDIGRVNDEPDLAKPPAFLEKFTSGMQALIRDHPVGDWSSLYATVQRGSDRYTMTANSDHHSRVYHTDESAATQSSLAKHNRAQAQRLVTCLSDFYASQLVPFRDIFTIEIMADFSLRLQPAYGDLEIHPSSKSLRNWLARLNTFADFVLAQS